MAYQVTVLVAGAHAGELAKRIAIETGGTTTTRGEGRWRDDDTGRWYVESQVTIVTVVDDTETVERVHEIVTDWLPGSGEIAALVTVADLVSARFVEVGA